ncbi:MAG: YIP1 family protein [Sphaerobacter sp.]|nr:YIP1 family protein [Sphaerobacter sp.]
MQQSLSNRVIGAARLDIATYEAVERDVNANAQALAVVVAGAIASGIGSIGAGGLTGLVGGVLAGLVSWVTYAAAAYLIGTRLLATSETRATLGEVLRTLGFAQAPRLLLVLAWIPLLGWLVSFVVAVWVLVATLIAVRQSMELTTGRAIGTALIAWVIMVVITGLFFSLF